MVVLREDDARVASRLADGWVMVARSWAAQLEAERGDLAALRVAADAARACGDLRELARGDVPAVLALDAATVGDYPGGPATAHAPLTAARAAVSGVRRAWGVVGDGGRVLAMTYVDVDGDRAETDFTVVARDARGRGLATAVKAASLLGLLRDGVVVFRTGGSANNAAILAASLACGYRVDERWVTLAPSV
ncbi:hypothetical protein [Demequina gelatinilytica]|uniref:hypothetical protein n=1 Tax=Demequina gelatinilytica TaxID=1638980 RepID=UPI000786393E|nr:hypothetical protein [Demequina gelatinilytica]